MPFKIIRNDITQMRVDAIVNTANPFPICGDGSDSAVYEAAGEDRLLEARRRIGIIEAGQAVITPAFALNARYIIHTVGPVYQNGIAGEAEVLFSCYKNSLKLAEENACESVAFPLISTGTYGYPKDEAMQIALAAISKFLLKSDLMVYLTVFDKESFMISKKLFADIDSFIDQNYVENSQKYEYSRDGIPQAKHRLYTESESSGLLMSDEVQFSAPKRLRESSVSYGEVDKSPVFGHDWEENHEKKKRSLEDVMAELEETFQERLLRLIDEKGFTDVEIYKKANLSRKLFSKIRCNSQYRPKKMTALALAIALQLNLDETTDLLARAELAFSPSSKFDVIIKYFIEREVFDIYTINLALFEHDQPLLGE